MSDKYSRERVQGFLHADGRRIVNGNGETVVLRGWGLGNWLNPEGFMIGGVPLVDMSRKPSDFALPRRFERGRTMIPTVRELCGTAYAEEFERRWIREYCTEDDIRLMAEQGYNSVRVPFSARLFLDEEPGIHFNEENFQILDRLLDWCEKYRVYAILDMHGAPGGQSGLACDDGIDNRAHTLTEPESRKRTVLLWEHIAERYKDRWIVGGYDFLNEPISGIGMIELLEDVRTLYEEIIAGIRKYDRNHLLTLEGEVFSGGTRLFNRDFDPECHNWCIHTHFYGFSPERKDLYRFLDASLRWNVPVWIGEGGSSNVSNAIYYDIASEFDIGFSVWVWKSAMEEDGSGAGFVKYPLPKGWAPIKAFINEGGPRPSYEESIKVFDEMLELMKPEHWTVDEERTRYLLRKGAFTLPAVGFDDPEESHRSIGWSFGNAYNYRPESHMKMVLKPGALPPEFRSFFAGPREPDTKGGCDNLCLELRPEEFVQYTIRHAAAGQTVQIEGRKVGAEPAQLTVCCGSMEATLVIDGAETKVYTLPITLTEGSNTVRIAACTGTVQLDTIAFQ